MSVIKKRKMNSSVLLFVVNVVDIAVSVLPYFSLKKYFEITNFVAQNEQIFLKSATDFPISYSKPPVWRYQKTPGILCKINVWGSKTKRLNLTNSTQIRRKETTF